MQALLPFRQIKTYIDDMVYGNQEGRAASFSYLTAAPSNNKAIIKMPAAIKKK